MEQMLFKFFDFLKQFKRSNGKMIFIVRNYENLLPYLTTCQNVFDQWRCKEVYITKNFRSNFNKSNNLFFINRCIFKIRRYLAENKANLVDFISPLFNHLSNKNISFSLFKY